MEFARKVASAVAEGVDFLSQRQFPSRHQILSNFVAVANGFYKYFLYKFLNFFFTRLLLAVSSTFLLLEFSMH